MTDSTLLVQIYVLALAVFAGYEVITKVPPTLHTPLMSGANAISGVVLIGALAVAGPEDTTAASIVGLLAVVFSTVNVVGGFAVTDRMLKMFHAEREARS